MTQSHGNTGEKVLVAIDIAKQRNAVLVQLPDESRKKFVVANKQSDFQEFLAYLKSLRLPCVIGLPVDEDSEAMHMFRIVLQEHQDLCCLRQSIEERANLYLKDNEDYNRLRTIPGIGPASRSAL